MDYYLYKLSFDGAIHFGAADSALSLQSSGDHFYADTLFSALCHTAGTLWGKAAIESLCAQVTEGRLLLSDSMPWRHHNGQDIYYLPKPCAVMQAKQNASPEMRKALKRMAWIPVPETSQPFGDEKWLVSPHTEPFGVHEMRTLAAVFDSEDTRPYQVGAYRFLPGCGLYFVAGCADQAQAQQLETLVRALGMGGIGGKVSAGYGSFCVKDEDIILLNGASHAQMQWLCHALTARKPENYLLLTTSLPTDDELDDTLHDAAYQLARRGGFVQSDTFSSTPQRKRTQYFLAAGAMLKKPFAGALYSVAGNGEHPVYRYAKPMMLGVDF